MINQIQTPTFPDIIQPRSPPPAHTISKMDQTIVYDKVEGFLKNPPMLSPCPDFVKKRAMRKHIQRALKQLVSLQSPIQGWLGLVLSPMVYTLLESTPIQSPQYPGNIAIYPPFARHVHKSTEPI
jgi:hypothetical protein